jgi:hypothetical protein
MGNCGKKAVAVVALAWTLSALGIAGIAQEKSSGNREDVAAKSLLSDSGPTFVVPVKEIPKRWTVIAYGDTRFTDPANTQVTNPKVRQWLVQRIASEHPDALMISGDLPYDGSNAADYEVFRKETEPWRAAKLRVYPALGNHELAHDAVKGLRNWWTAFPRLEEHRWYSVEFGNAYMIVLDSNLPLTVGSVQQTWLANQLAHLPKQTRFVMVELHHPPVADSTPPQTHMVGPNEAALAKFLEAQAPGMKAKMVVIGGHTHNYERFEEGGIVYLVSGGGGAKPYVVPRDANDLYKNPPVVNYHYIKFAFDGEKLNATMYRVDGDAATPVFEAKDGFSVVAAP